MLELYANAGCPYCQKVLKKLSELQIDFIWRSHDFMKGEESFGFKLGERLKFLFGRSTKRCNNV